jgi:hypothetical protein
MSHGNSKYDPSFPAIALKLGSEFAATISQLAKFFEVDPGTIGRWMQEHEEFKSAVLTARALADERVERSLFERATGYTHPAEKIFCNKDGEVTKVPYTEHYPPDNVSMIFWLKNRQREDWRDVQHQELSGVAGAPLPVINITLNTPQGQQSIAPAIDTTKVPALPDAITPPAQKRKPRKPNHKSP